MSLTLLRTLVAVADRGSFAAAADQVCVSHAAVGQQMRKLEELVQTELFDRSERSPRLNAVGLALVPRARAVLQDYDQMLDDLIGEARLYGELSLGVVQSTMRELVPRVLKQLVATYPQLHVRIVPGLSEELIEQVERRGLDAAILAIPGSPDPGFDWRPFAVEPLVLIVAPGAGETDVDTLLKTRPFIRHSRRATVGQLADRWLSKAGYTVEATMELDSLESVASMVAHDLGVSVVPDICVPDTAFSQLQRIPLNSFGLERQLGILTRADCAKTRLVEGLLAAVTRVVSETRDGGEFTPAQPS
ncbi:HTH-type transcriptional regulator CysL [Falsiruegeria litorea R37]|uniref:HTH-type transcriptional regulator CysL n=1 Tax=Falsiruegeria litorea R37 TaxID=1200284 RepID=A0A1Y5TV30_9RHOB|nr:LysR substrate-binding domain-containing protein [Falsiruegeria litorea]SLN73812.1 HTH-type transcriptional regulator CysL [Falsiruegeria litorea R37]